MCKSVGMEVNGESEVDGDTAIIEERERRGDRSLNTTQPPRNSPFSLFFFFGRNFHCFNGMIFRAETPWNLRSIIQRCEQELRMGRQVSVTHCPRE